MLVAGISTAMALPLTSQASDGTIKFTGAVTANTCAVSVNSGINAATGGAADVTVVLPIVSTAASQRRGQWRDSREDHGGRDILQHDPRHLCCVTPRYRW